MEEPSRRFEKTVAASSTLLRSVPSGPGEDGPEAAHLLGPEILRDAHENGLPAEVEPVAQGLDDLEIGDGRDGPGRAVVVDEAALVARVHLEQGMDETCLLRVSRNIGRAAHRVEDGPLERRVLLELVPERPDGLLGPSLAEQGLSVLRQLAVAVHVAFRKGPGEDVVDVHAVDLQRHDGKRGGVPQLEGPALVDPRGHPGQGERGRRQGGGGKGGNGRQEGLDHDGPFHFPVACRAAGCARRGCSRRGSRCRPSGLPPRTSRRPAGRDARRRGCRRRQTWRPPS